MNRSVILWLMVVGWAAQGMANDIHLSYGSHLLETKDQPAKVRISSEEPTVKLRMFVDSSATPTLRYATWQASGSLGVPIEKGDIDVPAAVDGSVVREISIPIPYAGAEKPLRFLVIVEEFTQQGNEPKRLVALDILRRESSELSETVRTIKESGILLATEEENVQNLFKRHQIAYGTPNSSQDHARFLFIASNSETSKLQDPKLIIEDPAPLYESEASTEIALLQKIQARIQQMQNRKNIP